MFDNDKSNDTVSGYSPLYGVPDQDAVKGSKAPICVSWKVGTDKNVATVVSSGTVYTRYLKTSLLIIDAD
jgi:alkaline phosphatase D